MWAVMSLAFVDTLKLIENDIKTGLYYIGTVVITHIITKIPS